MKRRKRLTKSVDIERVRRFGKSYTHPILVLLTFRNQLEVTRFGVVAGRAVGKAVKRNRAKRLLRAAIESREAEISPGWDVVIYARRPLIEASFQQVQVVLNSLLSRAHLIREDHDHEPHGG